MTMSRIIMLAIIYYYCCNNYTIMMVYCSPPEDPIKCLSKNNSDCTITNTYGAFPDRSVCRAAGVVYPSTEEELALFVADAVKKDRKMKVATRFSHSIPKLVCPDGEEGLLISTKNLNRVLMVNKSSRLITVQSGVTLRQLIDAAADADLALPYAPYWWGLTIGGLMATGAHGSTLWGLGSSVHDYVTQLRIVTPAAADDGYVKIWTLSESSENSDELNRLNSARVSLGVLGVISQVTLKLEPMFKRSITHLITNDSNFADEAITFGKEHEFGDLTWYPSQGKVLYRVDDRVTPDTPGRGTRDFIGFRSVPSPVLTVIRDSEEGQEVRKDDNGKCNNAKLYIATLGALAYGLTNNGILFIKYPVIGYQNRLQSSGGCLDSLEDARFTACPWDPRVNGLFFHQTTFSIGLSKARLFIKDVQKLVAMDPKSLCGVDIYDGILIRYVTASKAYLGKQEDSLDFDMTYFRSKDPNTPRLHQDIIEEIEQMAIFKYDALPHWGKNRNIVFREAISKYKDHENFLNVKQQFDPKGLFSSEWTNMILGLIDKKKSTEEKEGCALEGLCLCSKDIHCAPNKGYFCRPGKIFTDARVIGYQNCLQTSRGWLDSLKDARLTSCLWDPRIEGLFFHQTTLSIRLSKARLFINDVQNLVAMEPKSLCGIDFYDGILIRYVTASKAYLGKQEDSLDFDMIYFRSKDPNTPR